MECKKILKWSPLWRQKCPTLACKCLLKNNNNRAIINRLDNYLIPPPLKNGCLKHVDLKLYTKCPPWEPKSTHGLFHS